MAPSLASNTRSVYAGRGRPVTVVDLALLAGWAALGLHVALRQPRPPRSPVVDTVGRPRLLLRVLLVSGTAAAMIALERTIAGPPPSTAAAALGLGLLGSGLALHVAAHRALGPWWDAVVTIRADQPVVTHGPYAVVRHPLYLAVLLMAGGTLLAHPSVATGCGALGLVLGTALKIRTEERLLCRTIGEPYRRYAADVPTLFPRFNRGRR